VAGELTRWVATGTVARVRDRELAVVQKNTEVALAKVVGIADVANTGLMATGGLSMVKRQLEMLAPEDAGKLDHIETIAVLGMGQVIQRLANQ
jgi:hypothetical protein